VRCDRSCGRTSSTSFSPTCSSTECRPSACPLIGPTRARKGTSHATSTGCWKRCQTSASTGPTERQSPRDGWTSSMVAATPHSLFFGSSSGFAKEMLGVRSRVKQRSPGMSGSDCRTTAEMSVRLKQHTTPDGPGTLWLLDGDVHAVNPPKLDPYERSQVAAKTRGRQCHLRCSVNRLCHASGIAG